MPGRHFSFIWQAFPGTPTQAAIVARFNILVARLRSSPPRASRSSARRSKRTLPQLERPVNLLTFLKDLTRLRSDAVRWMTTGPHTWRATRAPPAERDYRLHPRTRGGGEVLSSDRGYGASDREELDSRFRGNDDVGRARRDSCHSRESGNPPPTSLSVSESQIMAMMSLPPMVFC